MANYMPAIEKLNVHNYKQWSKDIKHLLLEKNCWDLTVGNETAPKEEDPDYVKENRNFQNRGRIAQSLIYLNTESSFRNLIENCDSAAESWQILKKNFLPQSKTYNLQLFNEFINCKYDHEQSVGMYAARLEKLHLDLKKIDHIIDQKTLIFQLLRNLPKSFDTAILNALKMSEESFTYANIVDEIITDEQRRNLRKTDTSRQAFQTNHSRSKGAPCWKCDSGGRQNNRSDFRRRNSPFRSQRFVSPERQRQQRSPSPQEWKQRSRNQSRNRKDRQSRPTTPARGRNSSPTRSSEGYNRSVRSAHFTSVECNLSQSDETSSAWIFDTAATNHFINDKSLFSEYTPLQNEKLVVAAEGISLPILGKGLVRAKFGCQRLDLGEVMYSPKLRRNLISGPRFDKTDMYFNGGFGKIDAYERDRKIFSAKLINDLYYVDVKVLKPKNRSVSFTDKPVITKIDSHTYESNATKNKSNKPNMASDWHRRMAHMSIDAIYRTLKYNAVRGLKDVKSTKFNCDPCKLGKSTRVSFKFHDKIRSNKPLELIHMDIAGPMPSTGRDGERYYITMIDDFSRKTTVFPLRNKSDAFETFLRFQKRAERFLDRKIKAIRTDNGSEFCNSQFENYLDKKGIKHELTNTYTPEQNGLAENYNKTAKGAIRVLLEDSTLPKQFWPEAVLYFAYTWNRLCHTNQTKTPFELYSGNKPSVRHLQPFGSKVYVGIPHQKRNKLENTSKRGIIVGYALKTRGYRVYIEDEDEIQETINIIFKRFEQPKYQNQYKRTETDSENSNNSDPNNSDTESDYESKEQYQKRSQNDYRKYCNQERDEDEDDRPFWKKMEYDNNGSDREDGGAALGHYYPNLSEPREEESSEDEDPGTSQTPLPPTYPHETGPSTSAQPQTSDQTDSDSSEENRKPSRGPRKNTRWVRVPVTRKSGKTKGKMDIYYFEKDKTKRLRSLAEVKTYCKRNNLVFKPHTFNFRTTDNRKESGDDEDTSPNTFLSSNSNDNI